MVPVKPAVRSLASLLPVAFPPPNTPTPGFYGVFNRIRLSPVSRFRADRPDVGHSNVPHCRPSERPPVPNRSIAPEVEFREIRLTTIVYRPGRRVAQP